MAGYRKDWIKKRCWSWQRCDGCGQDFKIADAAFRQRLKNSKTGLVFHNKSCYNQYRDTHPEFRELFAHKKESTIHI